MDWRLLVLSAVSALVLALSLDSFYRRSDPEGCEMTYMRPNYLPIAELGPYTRFRQKYGLYLYRESGVDSESQEPTGTPVLFIPGNAGSYRQVRSIASHSAHVARSLRLSPDTNRTTFDFFTGISAILHICYHLIAILCSGC